MDVSIEEISIKLTPLLAWCKLGLRHCQGRECENAWKEIQKWVEDLVKKDVNYQKLRKET